MTPYRLSLYSDKKRQFSSICSLVNFLTHNAATIICPHTCSPLVKILHQRNGRRSILIGVKKLTIIL
jgi:hypothetical protein